MSRWRMAARHQVQRRVPCCQPLLRALPDRSTRRAVHPWGRCAGCGSWRSRQPPRRNRPTSRTRVWRRRARQILIDARTWTHSAWRYDAETIPLHRKRTMHFSPYDVFSPHSRVFAAGIVATTLKVVPTVRKWQQQARKRKPRRHGERCSQTASSVLGPWGKVSVCGDCATKCD